MADFDKLGGLGQGGFGKVYKVRHKVSKKEYAIKVIAKRQVKEQRMGKQLQNEVKIMYALNHDNIIKLHNHFEDNENVYLILEFAKGGQLWEKLSRVRRFDEKTAAQYMRDIVSGVELLHTRDPPIIHRDIKPENILIGADGKCKLADFGWSNMDNQGESRKTYCGTPDYLAPEMIRESGHDTKLDIWCLGVLIFELLSGKSPFAAHGVLDPKEQRRILERNVLSLKYEFPRDFPPLAKDLVQKLLKINPEQRLSCKEIREHPWFKAQKMVFPPIPGNEMAVPKDSGSEGPEDLTENQAKKWARQDSVPLP